MTKKSHCKTIKKCVSLWREWERIPRIKVIALPFITALGWLWLRFLKTPQQKCGYNLFFSSECLKNEGLIFIEWQSKFFFFFFGKEVGLEHKYETIETSIKYTNPIWLSPKTQMVKQNCFVQLTWNYEIQSKKLIIARKLHNTQKYINVALSSLTRLVDLTINFN